MEIGKCIERVLCVPLESILLALNVTHIDLFSLDVEGTEVGILKHFPFDRVTVDVWVIEHWGVNVQIKTDKLNTTQYLDVEDVEFIEFMENKGYYLFDVLCHGDTDYVFVHLTSDIIKPYGISRDKTKNRGICERKTLRHRLDAVIPDREPEQVSAREKR